MTAKELQAQLKQTFESIETRKKELSDQVGAYDLQIQDLLHHIENETCDAVDLVKIAVQLKNIRQLRRKCKIEREQLQSIYDPFKDRTKQIHKQLNQDLTTFETKTYKNRTNVIDNMNLLHKNNKTK